MKRAAPVAPEAARILLDLPAAAALLSISPWTLRELIQAGEIPAVKLPCPLNQRRALRRTLVSRVALEAFVAKHQDGGRP